MIEQLRSLAVFATVADLGSFRAAARSLALSPSVVSHHVAELERRLGVPLLYRTTRRLSLTPAGERLVTSAREMVRAAEQGLDAVSGASDSPSGALRVTAPAFLAETRLSRDLAAFTAEHPRVALTVSFTDAPRDLLRDGFDLALRAGKLADSTHRTRKLADMHRALVCSPRYLAGRPPPRSPADLAAWEYVQLSSRPPEVVLVHSGKKPVSLGFSPRVSVDSAAAVRELAIGGAGLATLPRLLTQTALQRRELVEVLPAWRPASVGVFAVWPNAAQRAGLSLRFLDFMAPRVAALFE